MKPTTKQSKTVYALQTCPGGGAWRTLETFDSAVRAIARYGNTMGRRRILQTWWDAAQRQHNAVLRDSEHDEAVEAATARAPEFVLVTADRDWYETDDGEPSRCAPRKQTGVYVNMTGR